MRYKLNLNNVLGGRVASGLVILAALGLAVYALHRLDQAPRTNDAYIFADSIGMAPEVSGRIVALFVQDNQRVTRGQALAEIDPEPFALQLDESRAQIAALRAEINLTARQVTAQNSGASAAATEVVRVKAELALAQDTLARQLPLLANGYVTAQQVDESRTNVQADEAALTAAIQQAAQAHQAVGDTASLMAQLSGAEAAEALAARDLRNTVVRAPFPGLVTGLNISVGAYAISGQPLFTLINAEHWYAVGDFRETELADMAIGDPATIWLLGAGNTELHGHVESLGWGVQPDSPGAPEITSPGLPAVGRTLNWVVVAQRFPVRILIEHPPPQFMRVGATVAILVRHAAAK